MLKLSQKQIIVLFVVFIASNFAIHAYSQSAELSTLTTQLNQTNTGIRAMYTTIRNLIFVICGVVALVVLPSKYQKMNSGDPDAGKSMLNWGGGILFVAAAAYLIQVIFFTN
ncbi:DUF4134 family protein [Siphonobacter sp. SORGH_AS_1065]|uniref:DUF4134 family protein n=1 Tax=Siphonobacter sp. SORGH_AS_1065 TaxID=3041795 RepID=UPI0027D789C4|nr:DUF4134 family protein [Siphonobacter sp. SORGH_AS_1065]